MSNISTDKKIEYLLYAVAEKTKMGLDMEDSVERAKSEIIHIWEQDMTEIENTASMVYGDNTGKNKQKGIK